MFASLSVLNFLTYHNPLFSLSIALINFSKSSKNFGNAHWLIYSIDCGNKKRFLLSNSMRSTERKLLSSYILQFTNDTQSRRRYDWMLTQSQLLVYLLFVFQYKQTKTLLLLYSLVRFTHYPRRIFHY